MALMSHVSTQFIEALKDISGCLPELPQADAFETLAFVREYERDLILPAGVAARDLLQADYSNGSATEDDQVKLINIETYGVLASADHATNPIRKGERKGADHGTGGLVWLLAKRDGLTGIAPIGRQTGNAAFTRNHPVKAAMDVLLPARPGFFICTWHACWQIAFF